MAFGLYFAVKVNRYGKSEPGYLAHLHSRMYRHRGLALGYNVKIQAALARVWGEDSVASGNVTEEVMVKDCLEVHS